MMTDEAVRMHTAWKVLWTIQLIISTLVWALYRQLPLKLVSRWWGWVSQIELPTSLRPTLIGFYVWLFRCRVDEAAITNLKEYRSLSDFFRRKLKPGIRPVDEGYILTCPCDGRILHVGEVVDGMLEQVKGVAYNLSDFFGPLGSDICRNYDQHFPDGCGEREDAAPTSIPEDEYMRALVHQCENRLFFCTIYLGPGDYHRFHAPTDWTVHSRRYFPGNLFSVNPSIAKRLRGLFSMNERAVYFGRWRHGFFSFAAVGATNVGSINVYCDQNLVTNRRHTPKTVGKYHSYDFTNVENNNDDLFLLDDVYDRDGEMLQKGAGGGVTIEKGDMIGDFNFGSTIVLVFEAPRNFSFSFKPGERVKYGQGLGSGHIDHCDHIM